MIELPAIYTDIIALADWMELTSLEAGDRNTSAGDLTKALALLVEDVDKAEELSLQVMLEIEHRASAASEAYPFEVKDASVLQAKEDWALYVAYIFCLCLSHFKWKPTRGASVDPWHLFEDLASIAAQNYVHGKVYKFGAGSTPGAAGFETKVNELCHALGEGGGYRKKSRLHKKDDKVDLVAWKDFADSRESKLIMFGQCAAGANWADKISELQPDAFWKHWVREAEVSPLIRSFYIPHMVLHEEFIYTGRYAGILFDRCRIAHSIWPTNDVIVADNRYSTWCASVFDGLSLS